MGFVELEVFRLRAGVDRDRFTRLDAELQVWSYLHRIGLVRRTVAVADDGEVVVVTIFSGADAPEAASNDVEGALAAFTETIDPSTYVRRVYRDLG